MLGKGADPTASLGAAVEGLGLGFGDNSGGNAEIVKILLEHNANPNGNPNDKTSPLHIAVSLLRYDLVELLLSHEADPNIKGRELIPYFGVSGEENTPLAFARHYSKGTARETKSASIRARLMQSGANYIEPETVGWELDDAMNPSPFEPDLDKHDDISEESETEDCNLDDAMNPAL